jgi:flagellar biogenesis protein FliO
MEAIRQVAAAAGVLVLLAAALHWLSGKRCRMAFPSRRAERRLQQMERLTLGPQHTLHLVKLDGRTLLVAAAPGGCTLLETAQALRETGEAVR